MAFICLPTEKSQEFKQALKDKTIDIGKLLSMTTEERTALFEKYAGDQAKAVNTLFEEKLVLKNKMLGIKNWASKVGGIGKYSEEGKAAVEKAMSDYKAAQQERIFSPRENEAFLNDLADKKMGVHISKEVAQKVFELSRKAEALKAAKESPNATYEQRTAWGHAVLDLREYAQAQAGINKELIANLPKTAMSTFDLSGALRQGWGMMSRPEWYSSFGKMFVYAAKEGAYRELQADIISRPTYARMEDGGLRISMLADSLSGREEQFMSNLANKIPGVRPSERAYAGFLNKLRADVFDHLLSSAELRGEDVQLGSQALKDIANVVNDFTGSGNVGPRDRYANLVPVLNAGFFSPRKISATINMLNPVRYASPAVSPTARIAAVRQLVGSVAITTTVLMLARLAGGKVETDPTSSDTGKVVFGKTHYDFTGGNGTYATLLARLIENKTKSTTSGKVTKLGQGYKPTTRADLIVKFGRNKLSPLGSLVGDWLYGSDAVGKPFKLSTEILNRSIPLIAQDVYQIEQDDPNNLFGSTAASLFGVGVQEY